MSKRAKKAIETVLNNTYPSKVKESKKALDTIFVEIKKLI